MDKCYFGCNYCVASLRLEQGYCLNNVLKEGGHLACFVENPGVIICIKPLKAHTNDTCISSRETVPLSPY